MAQVRNQEYGWVPVAQLTPHPANPRKGDVGAIARSVQANGFYGAVVAQRSTGYILAGNHRWQAARQEGLQRVPVIWLDCSDDEARRILLADNKTNDQAGYDQEALARVLEEARVVDAELTGTGWTPEGYDALIAQMGDAVLGGAGAAEAEFPALPTGEKSPFQQMTFTLHDEQAEIVKRALEAAKDDAVENHLNANSNGNALARICEEWVGAHGEG